MQANDPQLISIYECKNVKRVGTVHPPFSSADPAFGYATVQYMPLKSFESWLRRSFSSSVIPSLLTSSELKFELSLVGECPSVETMLGRIYALLIRHIWGKINNRVQTITLFRRNIEENVDLRRDQ